MGLRKRGKAPISEPQQPKTLYIGVDQSYTGFGLVVLDETGHCHQKSLLKWPSTKYKSDAERLGQIYADLCMYFAVHNSSKADIHISMEGYAHGAKFNREKLGELGGIVKLASYSIFGKEPAIVPPTTLKQFATGNGRASKEQMVAAAREFDPEVTNDNVADAYMLALMQSEA